MMENPAHPALGATLWWTRPHVFIACVTLPIFLVLIASAHQVITNNHAGYSSPDYITSGYVALFLAGLGVFGVASYVAGRLPPAATTMSFADRTLDLLFWSCAAAYAVWFGPLVLGHPTLILGALTGQAGAVYAVRELDLNVSGVTTVTQFGITYVCLYATKRFTLNEGLRSRYHLFFALIIVLALFRAIINSERIALLELVFPLLVVMGRRVSLRSLPLRLILPIFPLLTIFGSTVVFAVFEYNRSWLIHYQYLYDSLWQFAFERLSIYFVSSINNICGFMQHADWPTFHGEWTFAWMYRFPIVGPFLSSIVGESRGDLFSKFLKIGADEEFNNSTGVLTVFDDWGIVVGLLFMAAFGFIAGRGYRAYRSGRGVMQYVYPIIFYHIYEMLRIGYVFDGRGMAAIIGLLLAVAVGGRRMPGTAGVGATTFPLKVRAQTLPIH